jgi:hypothetical protein
VYVLSPLSFSASTLAKVLAVALNVFNKSLTAIFFLEFP